MVQAVVACMAGWLLHIAKSHQKYISAPTSQGTSTHAQTCACFWQPGGRPPSCSAAVPCRDATKLSRFVRGNASCFCAEAPHTSSIEALNGLETSPTIVTPAGGDAQQVFAEFLEHALSALAASFLLKHKAQTGCDSACFAEHHHRGLCRMDALHLLLMRYNEQPAVKG